MKKNRLCLHHICPMSKSVRIRSVLSIGWYLKFRWKCGISASLVYSCLFTSRRCTYSVLHHQNPRCAHGVKISDKALPLHWCLKANIPPFNKADLNSWLVSWEDRLPSMSVLYSEHRWMTNNKSERTQVNPLACDSGSSYSCQNQC